MAKGSGGDPVERDARSEKPESCGVGGRIAFGMCLNWRVLGALALVGLVVLVAAPSLAARALPLLFVAVCPLSMAAMMWAMRGRKTAPAPPVGVPETTAPPTKQKRAQGPIVSDLRSELAGMQAQQERLTRQIAALEAAAGQEEPAPCRLRDPDANGDDRGPGFSPAAGRMTQTPIRSAP